MGLGSARWGDVHFSEALPAWVLQTKIKRHVSAKAASRAMVDILMLSARRFETYMKGEGMNVLFPTDGAAIYRLWYCLGMSQEICLSLLENRLAILRCNGYGSIDYPLDENTTVHVDPQVCNSILLFR